jgi:hypothetical protein
MNGDQRVVGTEKESSPDTFHSSTDIEIHKKTDEKHIIYCIIENMEVLNTPDKPGARTAIIVSTNSPQGIT